MSGNISSSERQCRNKGAFRARSLPGFVLGTLASSALGFTAIQTVAAANTESSEQAKSLEETIIVASRIATPLSSLGVSVTLIDQDELSLLGYNDLASVLDLQTGVSVTRDGGMGKAATVRIRGEEGFRTRVQLDGIDIADPSSPQISPRIEHLITPGLQRIEILRGPQGLMYGADGGGVIAITSQQPTEGFTADIGAEGGSDNFQRYNLNLAGGSDQISGALSLADVSTDGFNARTSDTIDPDSDGYDNTTIHATINADISAQWRIGASVHDVDGSNAYDGCYDPVTFTPINDCTDDYAQTAWRVYLAWSTDNLQSELSVEESRIDRAFYSAGAESYSTEGEQQELSWLGSMSDDNQRLTVGVDLQEQTLNDGSTVRTRDNTGAYAEYQRDVLLGSISAGLRYDDNDDFGQHTSYRLSTIQHLGTASVPIALRAAIGTGFRAPSLYEVAYNAGPWAFPPASGSALIEEQSQGWEAGVQLGDNGSSLTITWFDQTIEDEIYFDLASYSGYLQRSGESSSKGLEITAEGTLGAGFSLNANTTWNETEDFAGNPRPYRPELSGALSLRWQGERVNTALTARFAQDSVDSFGTAMGDYQVLDWSALVRLGAGFSANARVENLTDEDYQQVQGYFSPGRQWFLGLRYSL